MLEALRLVMTFARTTTVDRVEGAIDEQGAVPDVIIGVRASNGDTGMRVLSTDPRDGLTNRRRAGRR